MVAKDKHLFYPQNLATGEIISVEHSARCWFPAVKLKSPKGETIINRRRMNFLNLFVNEGVGISYFLENIFKVSCGI